MDFVSMLKKKEKRSKTPKSLQSVFNVSCVVLLQHCFLSFLRDANFSSEHSEFGAEQLFLRKVIFSD